MATRTFKSNTGYPVTVFADGYTIRIPADEAYETSDPDLINTLEGLPNVSDAGEVGEPDDPEPAKEEKPKAEPKQDKSSEKDKSMKDEVKTKSSADRSTSG